MKRSLMLFLLIVLSATAVLAANYKTVRQYNKRTHQYTDFPLVSIHDIQYVPPEKLALADLQPQGLTSPQWTLQTSSFFHYADTGLVKRDTVVIHALVITPCAAEPPFAGITYTQHGWTMLIHDTLTMSNEWTGGIVRVGNAPLAVDSTQGPDTTRARSGGFLNPKRGDIISMTVYVDEFPSGSMNSMTQLDPDFDYPVIILSHNNPIPLPTEVTIDSFYVGTFPAGRVKYSSGEKYENGLVKMVSHPGNLLNVTTIVNGSRGTFNYVDKNGNSSSDYDVSHYFTFGNESAPVITGDTSFHFPPVGAVIDTIKGAMFTSSGGENVRGYRIGPLYPGDLKLGISLPTVKTHRRYPVVVTSLDTVRITDTVRYTGGGLPIFQAQLVYSINNGAWQTQVMTLQTADSLYQGVILDQDGQPLAAGTNVRYFLKGVDNGGQIKYLANASTLLGSDTSKGFFYYNVVTDANSLFSIHDLQYNPYHNGSIPYDGGLVHTGGIVTASSNDIGLTQRNPNSGEGGTTAWFIQNGNSPYAGMWVQKRTTDSTHFLDSLKRGDSVIVFGTMSNAGTIPHILDSTVTMIAHGRPVPQPVTLTTSTFYSNSDTIAPQYLNMLVRFVNANIYQLYPTFADSSEYSLVDGSGSAAVIRQDGINTWSNIPGDSTLGKNIFFKDDNFDTLIGVVTFGNRTYKICPRQNSDFVIGDTQSYPLGWNLLSVGRKQLPTAAYSTSLLFPGQTAFGYNGSYYVASTLLPGTGYWLRVSAGQQIFRQHGPIIKNDTIGLVAGWNLIGALGESIPTSSIGLFPVGNHLSSYFGYNGGYTPATSLTPRQGYWVKSDSVGYLVVNGPLNAPKTSANDKNRFNWVAITDADGNSQSLFFTQDADGKINLRDYEMPPVAPVEGFAVKYSSGRLLETYPPNVKEGKLFPIDVAAKHGPVTISWAINNTKEAKRFMLTDGANGKIFKSIELKGTGAAKNVKLAAAKMFLQVNSGTELPREFALSQNYPNPFNPTTRVQVSLPVSAHLEVAVFNILGQKVATLVDDMREAGYQVIEWNGTNDRGLAASSGVYFLRMNAGTFTATRKMMLLK